MKRHGKKHLAMLLSAMLTFAAVWQWMPVGVREVRAEGPTEVDDAADLLKAFSTANEGNTVTVRLTGSITLSRDDLASSAKYNLTGGNLTLDLNGCNIDASSVTSQNPIFSCSGGTLTIEDNSSSGDGKIISASEGKCIQTTSGTLNISGGKFTNAAQCLSVQNTEVNISGNPSFVTDGNGSTDIALRMTGDNTTVNISGGSFQSSYGTVWVMDAVTGSSLNINGGTFTAQEKNGSFAYVCSVDGACNVNISGGTFNLNPASGSARKGSALVLGDKATDDMVNITGGTFHGRIARAISDTSKANYEVFYGNGSTGGIIGEGSVLTNNTFYQNSESDKMYFTQDEVEVVPGSLVTFDTRRSWIESYGTDDTEKALADASDYYSMDPISVTADGKSVYANTHSLVLPTVEESRITDGNTYTFSGWYDEGGTAYVTLQDFIATGGMAGAGHRVTLSAGWKAQTGDEEGLISALKNTLVVSEIELIEDISLSASIAEDFLEVPINRNLDLGEHTISSTADDTAFVLYSPWSIKNGTINSSNQPCLEIDGTATIENLNCLAENASYAVKFYSNSYSGMVSSENRIISGVFEATGTEGHALCYANGVSSEDITNLFGDSYASSTATVTDDEEIVSLSASRLIVSQSPITYIANGADVNLGFHVYRESIPVTTQIISNEEYVGDIVITGVSVDNPVFTVTGEGEPKSLRGGVSQTASNYSYMVGVAENTDVGSYTGTATITYTKMDGSEGTYTQKLSVTIEQATPYISIVPVASEITYGQTLDASKLSGGTVLYGTGTGQAASAENAEDYGNTPVAGTFAWKDATVKPVVADSGKTSYTVVFTPEDSDNYETVETSITLTVNKAKNTPNIPENTMNVPYSIKKVSDVTLPTGWVWQDADKTKTLTVGEAVTATAIYNGADKGNYVTEVVEIAITRLACTHSGETEVRDVKEATCSEKGYTGDTYCKDCGEKLKTGTTTPALGHNYTGKVTTEPTTISEGVMTYTCDRCGHSYTRAIAKLQDNNNNPTDNNPGENQPGGENTPDTGKPYIKDETGKEGWEVIKDEVDKAKDGDSIVVEMNGSSVVPGDVLDEIKGKDVTIVFDMGNGITWSVNGQSITGDRIGDIDFSVKTGTNTIPIDIINNVTGERKSQQISLAYDGEFGFTAVLSINMEASNAGLYANLFYYNEKTGELEFICADEIAEDGTTELTFTHASDYTIVIDTEPMGGEMEEVPDSDTNEDTSDADTAESEKDYSLTSVEVSENAWNFWWIIVIGVFIMLVGFGAFLMFRKKEEEQE